ncbi:MAG: Ig-like domain-containing protein [Candidatus Marinimicrobia bacterium]|nr:Ig-like domain-containing protein [Candidatus Neomarinimicrobiota bacterium]MCF7828688.1 Ig-like domain-containing protein [Candidatus Neomarinimicrobiota bacterium]MCF7880429.1 Ig-like domain-containing protein [Candidatus Neomarinimicrobiota bacterium]
MIRYLSRIGGAILFGILLWTCANEAPPPGGPEDVDPPRIVYTHPEPGSVEIAKNTNIVIEFSEYLNRRSVEPSIFISPYIEQGFEVDISRRTVTIDFIEQLADSTTYIVTLSTGVADLRGNKLTESYQLAFSTGQSIDQGSIAGKIYRGDMEDGDVSIIAYEHGGIHPDTLIKRRPDYLANPDAEGRFSFSNMSLGEYFILALQDNNSNYAYDPGEWTGIPQQTFWGVEDSAATDVLRMQMFKYPADSLVLTKVEQQNRHRMIIGFNRPPKNPPTPDNIQFIAADTTHPVSVAPGESNGEYLVEHYATIPDSTYQLIVKGLTDGFDIPFGTKRNIRDVEITTEPDTLPLSAPQISIADSSEKIVQTTSLRITFPRAVQPVEPDTLLNISGVAASEVDLFWENGQTLVAKPASLWPAESWIKWMLKDSLIYDYRDSTYSDSVTTGVFRTETGGEYGQITGTIAFPDRWENGQVFVKANRATGETVGTTTPDTSGQFRLNRIPAGEYTLESFYDADSSGDYSFGRPTPFVPSEYFVIFSDSIAVRVRWESSGYNLEYPTIQ